MSHHTYLYNQNTTSITLTSHGLECWRRNSFTYVYSSFNHFLPFHTRILRSECGGTWWCMGGEVKGKLVNGVGSQYSHTTSEHGVSSITNADAHTSAASSRPNWLPADLNGLIRLGERRNLVSARVPSGSARALSARHRETVNAPTVTRGTWHSRHTAILQTYRKLNK